MRGIAVITTRCSCGVSFALTAIRCCNCSGVGPSATTALRTSAVVAVEGVAAAMVADGEAGAGEAFVAGADDGAAVAAGAVVAI